MQVKERNNMQAEIYTKSNCSYCVKAKALLNSKGIEYKEFIISAGINEHAPTSNQFYVSREYLLEKAPGAKTVPQIWLEGNYVGGYTELAAFFEGN
jgi:glutaredoxin 3